MPFGCDIVSDSEECIIRLLNIPSSFLQSSIVTERILAIDLELPCLAQKWSSMGRHLADSLQGGYLAAFAGQHGCQEPPIVQDEYMHGQQSLKNRMTDKSAPAHVMLKHLRPRVTFDPCPSALA